MKYEYWFAAIQKITGEKKWILRNMYNSAKELYYIEETELKKQNILDQQDVQHLQASKKAWNLDKEYEKLSRYEIELILFFDSRYPEQLKEIYDPPYALYIKGKLPDNDHLAVAIVGARECTSYGSFMAQEIAGVLAQNNIGVISGLAKGIDGAAGRGALNAGGKSYAVLGCGADICYPREHIGLYMDIQKSGAIISEQPLGVPPLKYNFPARNRIISGLAEMVIVIEARERSGSLITADMALEQGKDIYALPGPVNSALSKGCNTLIRQGAAILTSAEDLLLDLEMKYERNVKKTTKNKIKLESAENLVYSCLDLFPKSMGAIINETKLSAAELMNILIALELQGYAEEVSKNYYIRTK